MNWINLLIRGSKAIENNTSLISHLEELRKRLIFVLIFFVVVMVASLAFVGKLYHFLSRPMAGFKLIVLGPGDVVQVYFMIAGVVAFAMTTPFLLWQLWKFVSPGLFPRERRYARRLILPAAVMFLAGICFGYFIIFPEILRFLKTLAEQNFTVSFTAKEYFSFMFDILIPFGLLFEMPIVIVFLTRIGVLTPTWLRKMRRFAYLIFVLLGVLISPPELISHLSVVVPMILIYEGSIWLAEVAYRRKLKAEAWWRKDQPATVAVPVREESHVIDQDEPVPANPVVEATIVTLDRVSAATSAPSRSETQFLERLADLQRQPPVIRKQPGIGVEERE